MWPDLSNQVALVTGGTRGVGLAIGQALGRHGASVWLTHRWGSADEAQIAQSFGSAALPPRVVEADVGNDDDTERLLARISEEEMLALIRGSSEPFVHDRELSPALTSSYQAGRPRVG